jgi:hypothetical protein
MLNCLLGSETAAPGRTAPRISAFGFGSDIPWPWQAKRLFGGKSPDLWTCLVNPHLMYISCNVIYLFIGHSVPIALINRCPTHLAGLGQWRERQDAPHDLPPAGRSPAGPRPVHHCIFLHSHADDRLPWHSGRVTSAQYASLRASIQYIPYTLTPTAQQISPCKHVKQIRGPSIIPLTCGSSRPIVLGMKNSAIILPLQPGVERSCSNWYRHCCYLALNQAWGSDNLHWHDGWGQGEG